MSLRSLFLRCLAATLALAAIARAQTTAVPTLTQPIPAQTLSGSAAVTIDLKNYFSVPGITGQVVQFDTVKGKFNAELQAASAPKTVTNFLNYVNRGAYTNTIIHRSVPGFVIQGGGFALSGTSLNTIASDAPVVNEFKLSNTRGTMAMAKLGSGPDTATNQWFVNLADNSANLDAQNGGFTVFARVMGTGMSVADAIAAVTVYNASSQLGATFDSLPLLGQDLTVANLILFSSVKVVPIFPVTGSTASVVSFSATSSNTAVVTTSFDGSNLILTPKGSGAASVTVTATDTNGNTATGVILLNGQIGDAPSLITQPLSQTIAAGGTATFTVSAFGTNPLSYQWRKDGVAIAGATASTLTLNNLTTLQGGDYTVVVTNPLGSVTSRFARLVIGTPVPSRLANLSVRSLAGIDGQPLIVGFSISGGTKAVLIRGVGPTLANYGVGNAVVDPTLKIFDGPGTLLQQNDDWAGATALKTAFAQVGAFQLASDASKDSALLINATDARTVQVIGKTSASGVALIEVYDTVNSTSPKLVNLSARNFVGTGENVLIAGFVVDGTAPKKLLIRGVGPTLADYAVTGVLADPKIELALRKDDGSTVSFATADNWTEEANAGEIAATAATVGAFALKNGSKDASMLVTVPAGVFTVTLSGVNATTGNALIEVYEVP